MQPGEVKGLHTVPQTNLNHHLYSTSYLNILQPCELTDLHSSRLPSKNPDDQYPPHFNTYNNNSNTAFLINPQIHHQVMEFSSNTSSSLSNKNSNSIEANKEQTYMSINHERKLKRLISNRESARRSRMRKRKQLEELQLQIVQLQDLYHKLTEKFINLLESNHRVLQENAQLKEEVSFFRKMVVVNDIPFRDTDQDVTRDMACVRAEGCSNQFMSTSSMDVLH